MTLVSPNPPSQTQTAIHAPPVSPAAARPAQTLIDTGRRCLEAREWKKAIIALESARKLQPDDHTIDNLLLEAAANAHRRALTKQVRARLGVRLTRTHDGLIAESASRLSERNFSAADKAARAAIKLDPGNARGWTLLAASYAGLGWFAQAEECLDGAARHGVASPLDLWYLGRATNVWGMDRSRALIATLVTSVLAGVFIAFSVGIATPFFTREVRVRKLPERIHHLAQVQWTTDPKPRVIAGAASLFFLIVAVGFIYLSTTAGA